jgi:hypothetical protein
MSTPEPEFRELCLQAATVLAKLPNGGKGDVAILKTLASRIRAIADTDHTTYGLMDTQLSLVWDIVRGYSPGANTFEEFLQSTATIASTLEKSRLSKAEIKKLFKLCIALHSVSISTYNLRDFPSYHPDLVTFA